MFALYSKRAVEAGNQYLFSKSISLFGCNVGFIPAMLKLSLSSDASEPYAWRIDVGGAMGEMGHADQTILIDLMPRASTVSLYELVDVWGFSKNGWTPLMFHLRSFFVEEDPSPHTKQDFIRLDHEIGDPIFSMTYMPGSSISKGKLMGKWLPPGPSSTNSVLLWPEAFKYFVDQAAQLMARPGS